jgi:hypothetical protein
MLSIKIHKSYRDVVSICDSELIGKYLEEKDKQLEIKESFYKGEEYNLEKAKEIIKKMSAEDATFNIVGKKAIQCAIETNVINEKGIKYIQNIPFALILL